jgi:hypothetical protein
MFNNKKPKSLDIYYETSNYILLMSQYKNNYEMSNDTESQLH